MTQASTRVRCTCCRRRLTSTWPRCTCPSLAATWVSSVTTRPSTWACRSSVRSRLSSTDTEATHANSKYSSLLLHVMVDGQATDVTYYKNTEYFNLTAMHLNSSSILQGEGIASQTRAMSRVYLKWLKPLHFYVLYCTASLSLFVFLAILCSVKTRVVSGWN